MALVPDAVAVFLASGMAALARGVPESFADLAESISPAVVNITTATLIAQDTDTAPDGAGRLAVRGAVPRFLRPRTRPRGRHAADPAHRTRSGSGFVISEDGYIVTNNHVIDGADEIMIEFFDGLGTLRGDRSWAPTPTPTSRC